MPRKKTPAFRINARFVRAHEASSGDGRIDRRTFVAAAAGATLVGGPLAKAAAKAARAGKLSVRRRLDSAGHLRAVTVSGGAGATWTVDLGLYAGHPTLEAIEDGGGLTLRLRDAELPGTSFRVAFDATVSPGLLGHRLEMRFFDTGVRASVFTVTADLGEWLRGEAKASCPLPSGLMGDPHATMSPHAAVEATDGGTLTIHPDGAFELSDGEIRVVIDGDSLAVGSLRVTPKRRAAEGLISGRSRGFTTLEGEAAARWPGKVDLSAGGWRLAGELADMHELRVELHAGAAGALLASRGAGSFRAHAGDALRLSLEDARLVRLLGPEPRTAFAANPGSEGSWLSFEGCNLELALDENERDLYVEDDPDAEPPIRTVVRRMALSMEGAVVSVADGPPLPVEVELQRDRIGGITARDLIQIRPDIFVAKVRPLEVTVVRRLDMLSLSFRFVNLQMSTGRGTPQLSRITANKPAYVVVTFPSQSLAELAINEDDTGTILQADPRPVPSHISGPSRLVFLIPADAPPILMNLVGDDGQGRHGLLDWSAWRPSIVPTAYSSYARNAFTVNPSFVSPAENFRFLEDRVRYSKPTPVLNPPPPPSPPMRAMVHTAAPTMGGPGTAQVQRGQVQRIEIERLEDRLPQIRDIDALKFVRFIPTERIPIDSSDLYTYLEMPTRLFLSPDELGRWIHARLPVTRGPRTELWHTRLGEFRTSGPPEEAGVTVRAVDAVDFEPDEPDIFQPIPPNGSLNGAPLPRGAEPAMYGNRAGVVDGSGNHRRELVLNMVHRGDNKDSRPFFIERLMLSPLGGYLKGKGNWAERWNPRPKQWEKSQVLAWSHISTLGRDHYVKVVERGYLFPTGHPAALVSISERKVQQAKAGGPTIAYLRKRKFVVVRGPTVTFSEPQQRSLGFRRLTLHTLETPPLSPDPLGLPGEAGNDSVFWIDTSAGYFPFNVEGEDVEGRTATWAMPLIFVKDPQAQNQATVNALIARYLSNSDQGYIRRIPVRGQKLAFAPKNPAAPNLQASDDSTAYPVNEVFFTARWIGGTAIEDRPGWVCELNTAKVSVAALEHVNPAVAPGPVEVRIPEVYKSDGFGPANVSDTFLTFLQAKELKFGGDTAKSGGVVNPDQIIRGLARGKGPIGGSEAQQKVGKMLTEELLPDTGKILGAVSLWQLLPSQIDLIRFDENNPNSYKSPRLELKVDKNDTTKKPIRARVVFTWVPEVGNWPPAEPIFKVRIPWSKEPGQRILSLDAQVVVDLEDASKSTYSFVGELRAFDIDCIKPIGSFIILSFDSLKFTAEKGQPFTIALSPKFPRTKFVGPLTFVQKLQDLFKEVSSAENLLASTSPRPALEVGFKPFLELESDRIRAGFTLGLPSLGVGVFSIQNMSLSAEANLPLIGEAMRVRFAFCERENQFRLSVMGFAGGGFVAIAIGPEDVELLEAAFEFGGSLSLDIGVASGGVSIMAGVYYKLEAKKSTLEGYLKLNGRLSVLGLIRISITFLLSLTWEISNERVFGTATVTVEVEILFFSASVSMTVQREFASGKSNALGGSRREIASLGGRFAADPEPLRFTDVVSQSQWSSEYCAAFA